MKNRLLIACSLFFVCLFFNSAKVEASGYFVKNGILYETAADSVCVKKMMSEVSPDVYIIEEKGTIVDVQRIEKSGTQEWAVLGSQEYTLLDNLREHEHDFSYGGYTKWEYTYDESDKKEAVKRHRIYYLEFDMCKCKKSKLKNERFEEKKHSFEDETCSQCGYARRLEFKEGIPFRAVKDGVPVRKKATSKDKTIYKMDEGEKVQIVARYRSDNGNLWFENTNGEYIYYENLALDLDTLLNENLEYVEQFGYSEKMQFAAFLEKAREKGDWDYKIPLGWDIYYNVALGNNIFKMTGEQLGNYNYGYVGTGIGYSKEFLTIGGGILNVAGGSGFKYCDTVNFCDKPEDVTYVKKGINAYKKRG